MADTVGFIGLGTMGMPMAANLAKAGVALVVHDQSEAARTAGAALPGASGGRSAAEVARRSRVLFTCLPNDAIVRDVYLGADGIGSGAHADLITCDCSTVSPEVTVEIGRALGARGVQHLDTPMLGSKPQAVEGQIFFIVGGDRSAVAPVVPYLEIMGKLHMYVGGPGTANRVKLLHNGLAAATSVAVAEALAVCVQTGVDPSVFYEVVRHGGGMAYGTYFERRARRILDGDFSPTFALALMRKDAALALALARSAAVPVPILEETLRTYEAAVDGGWGGEDFSAVTHVIEGRIGRPLSPPAAKSGAGA
jgi:3-hydroxyisobutyrate dehydrogenase-like beta-hydroxyacid dehydrogenase